MDDTKVCKKCGSEKPITEFYKVGGTDGRVDEYRSKCKACCNEQTLARYQIRKQDPVFRERQRVGEQLYREKVKADPARLKAVQEKKTQWWLKHKARLLAERRERYRTDPEFRKYLKDFIAKKKDEYRERRNASSREYRNRNKERVDSHKRKWADQHKLQMRVKAREWALANPDKASNKKKNLRAQWRGSEGRFTVAEWNALVLECGGKCLRCGIIPSGRDLTADHVISVRKGGANTIDNIQPLCRGCNSIKRNRNWDYRVGKNGHDAEKEDTAKRRLEILARAREKGREARRKKSSAEHDPRAADGTGEKGGKALGRSSQ